jgi:alkanesulfonate monooxygenase SsuD/methylene tetrahydromethanopterin reductase-like flavin-dependent oxidoreductase (luciferase family)
MPQKPDNAPRRGLFIAPFDELSDPHVLVELAIAAEERGWDGLFLWDHIAYRAPIEAVADPWIVMSAIAARTERLLLGPLVTPLARRRVQKVARETVTLDQLSRGRLVFGVGLGSDGSGELAPFGEELDPRKRAVMLDDGLTRLTELWAGEFQPTPVQHQRIPIWVAAKWPNRRPVRRAVRWDGLFPIELPGPEALAELAAEIERDRDGGLTGFDLVIEIAAGAEVAPWRSAGATWVLTEFGMQPRVREIREVIEAGPR